MFQPLSQRFLHYTRDHHLALANCRLLVAVSGGLDSVVLCHLLQELHVPFAIAHCHFGLRAAESDRDAAFVADLAKELSVPFFIRHFDTNEFAAANRCSIQEAARTLRYNWFQELLADEANWHLHLSAVATAHHLDDNIETVVMNFFKGTGISGLRGILPIQGKLVRPLLFARRSELAEYAASHKLSWVEDSSNAETKYTRNFFRHEVLPLVQQKFPQAMENMAANIQRFSEVEILYQQALHQHLKGLCVYKGSEVHVPVLKLAKTVPLETVAFELLKAYGFSAQQTGSVLHLLDSESGRYVQSATHQVVRHRRWLVIAPLQLEESSLVLIEQDLEKVNFGTRVLLLEQVAVPSNLKTAADTALVDFHKLKFPLVLRKWKAGDYFYPLGLGKKKKVSRLLIDLKLSKTEKEQVYVLESGNKIVWVVGHRLDDRFKIGPATRQAYRVQLNG
ncbi:tRNA(Ile)-lysidine synthase [Cnuella takakiae]|uniref:tRNA(Ile)-lysidine synthase n=1 Tax=Cnuella takakiae TaxID=1302690 RepID=A0A1M4Y212_9BACT|nr:tRNA lysidine(34) synthetase TilS [Cnuella takakiae]OLY93014.1 tRNA lysidine(34) synthetase TilS [Cnuella takakiae]SHE99512.1 tRNA(Ile)-lysidine synthase [Cnuella takakiae]